MKTLPRPYNRLRRVVAAAFLPLLAPTLLAPTLLAQSPSTVTLYEHSVYRGKAIALPLHILKRNVPLDIGAFNDKTTSLRWNLAAGVRVVFFHDKGGKGTQYTISSRAARVGRSSNVGSTHNDKFSSLMWQIDDGRAGSVTVYDGIGGGASDYLPLSSYAPNQVHRLYGMADKVSSLRWSLPRNVIVTFYEHSDGSGREFTLMHDISRNGGPSPLNSSYNNKFSSFAWRTVDPTKGWVSLYTDKRLRGYHLTRYFAAPGVVSLRAEGYDNQVDSLRWSMPQNRTVVLCEGPSNLGAGLALRGAGRLDDLTVHAGGIYHDAISSVGYHEGSLGSDLSDRDEPINENLYLASESSAVSSARGYDFATQGKDIAWQLDYGVRSLHIQTHLDGGVLYASVNTRGSKHRHTKESFLPVLMDIGNWLNRNSQEVIFLRLDNTTTSRLPADFILSRVSPIRDKIYVHRNGRWPSVHDLLRMRKQVVVFTSRAAQHPSLMVDHDHMCENVKSGVNRMLVRSGSAPISRRHRALFFMSHLPDGTTRLPVTPTALDLANLANRFTQHCNFINLRQVHRLDSGINAVRLFNTLRRKAARSSGERAYAYVWGAACEANAPTLQPATIPTINGNLRIDFGRSFTGFLAIGFSDAQPMTLPMGAACTLRVPIDLLMAVPGPNSVSFGIPNQRSLAGVDLFMQGAYGARVMLTQAARVRLGVR